MPVCILLVVLWDRVITVAVDLNKFENDHVLIFWLLLDNIFYIVTTLYIDVAKNDLLAFKFGTNVVVVMIYLSSPRTKQTTKN